MTHIFRRCVEVKHVYNSWLSQLRRTAVSLVATAVLVTSTVFPQDALPVVNAAGEDVIVYDDRLQPGFANYSWAQVNLESKAVVRSGTQSIEMNPSNEGGLYLYKERVASVKDHPVLEFWVNGGAQGGQKLRLVLIAGGQQVGEKTLDELLPEGRVTSSWQKVQLDIGKLNVPNGLYDTILLQDTSRGGQPSIYFDDIRLTHGSPAQTPPQRTMSGLQLSAGNVQLQAGATTQLYASAMYSDGTTDVVPQGVVWESSNPGIASVDRGVVRAIAVGDTVVSATYGGFQAAANVRVTPTNPNPNPTPGGPVPAIDGIAVYNEALHASFQNYSWAQHDLSAAQPVYTGTKSIRMNPSNQGALYLYKGDGWVDTKEHDRLELWVHGGDAGGQQLTIGFNAGGVSVATVNAADYAEGGHLAPKVWTKISIQLTALNMTNSIFDALVIRGAAEGTQPDVWIDDIHLLKKYVAPPELLETVLSTYEMLLLPGDHAQLDLTANYSNGESKDASGLAVWTVEQPNVLTVSPTGHVTALAEGITRITATYGGKSSSMYVQVTKVAPEAAYTDGLAPGYSNWTWGTARFDSTAYAHQGTQSIAFHATAYQGIWLNRSAGKLNTKEHYGLEFWVHGGSSSRQSLNVVLQDGQSVVGSVLLNSLLPDGIQPGVWNYVRVKMADLGVSSPTFDGIVIQAWGEQDQGYVYLDDFAFLRNMNVTRLPDPELPKIQVTVNPNAPRRTMSKDIFGVNFEEMPHQNTTQMKFPVVRWGGNQMSRYNWELDVTNRAGDWYFLNLPNGTVDPSQLPNGSLSDRFLTKQQQDGSKVLMQIPTIGWTPKSRDVTWSFSIDKYGAQRGNECDWGEAWCRRDAGNGHRPDGSYVTGNDPTDTSRRYGVDFMARWIDHMKSRFGNFVRHYALDNEPALWGHTHFDVHPEMTTYDEIWKYTEEYGSMIKQKDPQAVVYGPVAWGWCEYFYSAKDGCFPGEDMRTHDNKPFLEWYLSKVREHEQRTGVKLVDVLDIHYYPAESGIPFTSDESAATTKRRLNALKSLYDPTFQDPSSWIQEPVRLLPRMRELIEQNAPGTKLAITEYNFGDGAGIGSGLAQAEALAIFAREGVDLATRWGGLHANTPLEDAFKLYLNYDGQGGSIEGQVVQTSSSNADLVGSYTIEAANGKTYVLLFNKDTAARTADVSLSRNVAGTAKTYMFDAGTRLQRSTDTAVNGGEMSVRLPARSATLVVIE